MEGYVNLLAVSVPLIRPFDVLWVIGPPLSTDSGQGQFHLQLSIASAEDPTRIIPELHTVAVEPACPISVLALRRSLGYCSSMCRDRLRHISPISEGSLGVTLRAAAQARVGEFARNPARAIPILCRLHRGL